MTFHQLIAQNSTRILQSKARLNRCRHCGRPLVLLPRAEVVQVDEGTHEYIHLWVHEEGIGMFCNEEETTEAEPLEVLH